MPVERRRTGFTLLEVLVATAVFAVAALALLRAQNSQVSTDQRLEEKTFAHWVALNRLAEMRLQNVFPDVGEGEATAAMAGRDWLITTKVQGTPSQNVRLVIVSVAPQSKEFGEKLPPVSVITGFLPRAQKSNVAVTPSP